MRAFSLKTGLHHPGVRLFFLLGYCCFIFYLSSLSDVGPSNLPVGADKVVHLGLYAGLGFLALHFFSAKATRPRLWGWWMAWLFSVLYGLSDEFHQSFVPHRTPSFWDLVFDALGAAGGILLYHRVTRWFLDTP